MHAQPAFILIWLAMMAIPMLFTPRTDRLTVRFRVQVALLAVGFCFATALLIWR